MSTVDPAVVRKADEWLREAHLLYEGESLGIDLAKPGTDYTRHLTVLYRKLRLPVFQWMITRDEEKFLTHHGFHRLVFCWRYIKQIRQHRFSWYWEPCSDAWRMLDMEVAGGER